MGQEVSDFFLCQFLEGGKISKTLTLQELSYLNYLHYDTTTYYALPICRIATVTHTKAPHLHRAVPTAYGAADMVSLTWKR